MANFGDIPSGLSIPATYLIGRNAGDSAFEAVNPASLGGAGLSIGDTITGGTANRVLYQSGSVLAQSSGLVFDQTNAILTVGSARIHTPTYSTNLFIGLGAGNVSTANQLNVGVGSYTGSAITSGYYNCLFGPDVGKLITTGTGNAFFGYGAGASNLTGSNNSFFGTNAGNVFTGSNGSFFGYNAGALATGSGNSFFGSYAGASVTTSSENSFFGSTAGQSTTGDSNSFFGSNAGFTNTTGASNVAIGYRAGYSNSTGSGNVFIGKDSGYSETGSNKLWIANIYNDHLIYGEFDNHLLRVNGRLGARYTTEQMRLEYDASNYLSITIGSSGMATTNSVGSADGIDLQVSGTSRIKMNETGIGFFTATPTAKPGVTGSRADGSALVSLLSALNTLGLISDTTTV